MKTIVRVIEKMNYYITRAFSYLTFILILTLTYEVCVRYGFGSPTQWSFDVTYFTSSLFLALGLAYTWAIGGHVSVDLITAKLPKRVSAAIFVVFMLALFFTAWGNIINVMIPHVAYAWKIKEASTIGSLPPIYPFKTWILVGVILLFVQGIAELLKQLHIVITGKEMFQAGGENQ